MRKVSIASELLRKLASSAEQGKPPADRPGAGAPLTVGRAGEGRPGEIAPDAWKKATLDHE